MISNKTVADTKPATAVETRPATVALSTKDILKSIGGSRCEHFNDILLNQTVRTLWRDH
jgi:hypothetical protein